MAGTSGRSCWPRVLGVRHGPCTAQRRRDRLCGNDGVGDPGYLVLGSGGRDPGPAAREPGGLAPPVRWPLQQPERLLLAVPGIRAAHGARSVAAGVFLRVALDLDLRARPGRLLPADAPALPDGPPAFAALATPPVAYPGSPRGGRGADGGGGLAAQGPDPGERQPLDRGRYRRYRGDAAARGRGAPRRVRARLGRRCRLAVPTVRRRGAPATEVARLRRGPHLRRARHLVARCAVRAARGRLGSGSPLPAEHTRRCGHHRLEVSPS